MKNHRSSDVEQTRPRLVVPALVLLAFLAVCSHLEPRVSDHDRRMAWWREARVGLFVHWGLYSIPAGEWNGQRTAGLGEWIQKDLRIPAAEYDQLVSRFTVVSFDAASWARLARQSGVRYVVIGTKHHEGFALWDSQVSDFDVAAAPVRRDLLYELSNAFRREGLQVGYYYSIMDWHHQDAQGRYFPDYEGKRNPDWGRYATSFMKPQLAELLQNHGPVSVLWFDGEWIDEWDDDQGWDLYHFIRTLQPDIIVNDRVGKGRAGLSGSPASSTSPGDFGTPEQTVPETGLPGVDWETCMTMNDTWGYKSFDQNWKSPQTLIRTMIDVASKGGNFLLNVGPTPEGTFPLPSIERLEALGRWLGENGEAIYGTSASPTAAPIWGRMTRKTGNLYLHVFQWPASGTLEVPLLVSVRRAYFLSDPSKTPLSVSTSARGLTIAVPPTAPDPIATVIALDIEDEPNPVP